MIVTELLAIFADPNAIHSLSSSDKLLAGLITTILGMGITFTALIVLQFIISWMDKLLNMQQAPQSSPPLTSPTDSPLPKATPEPEPQQDDNELVAVIASVIAMKMKTSVENIVIKNIEKIDDQSPAWNRAGIIEQMNNRF